ncbi:NUDIX domain-containing protein [Parachlamydia acanthamoebae]|uniref:NUDIX domain-containing protein n=1 Tax=Parachlamydia acanthamoebae TaxID=83552 RepID=UPI0001C177F4|nr:NUDIX hydrolase [Parachlamydia acanthamoebae]EFB40247.1 hypothetical protein pah_c221o041 [Parachlamydia acanthamoebae str. Hall's coccus]
MTSSLQLSTSSPQRQASDSGTNSIIPYHKTIRELFEKSTAKDPFNNCIIDLSGKPETNEKQLQQTVQTIFSEFLENQTNYQHLIVKISQKQNRLYKWMVNNDFELHHSEGKNLFLKRCLGHQENECTYPRYKTMSIGVTTVIFNKDLTEFLAIKEMSGPYIDWKAPTGSVEEEKETPLEAAVRDVLEETNLEISLEHLHLVSTISTKNFRGNKPDYNFVYAGISNHPGDIKPKEKDIKDVAWLSVNDFLKGELPVKHELRPLILQQVVSIAKECLEKNQGWGASPAYWGSGKPAILFQKT